MRVLAFDTSSPVCAIAVSDGDRVLAHDERESDRRHAEVLLPRIEAVLGAARVPLSDIELLSVGIGPGSFTGLRVGLATAKGLALATGIPLCGVSSLRVLARGIVEDTELALAVLDAGKGEVFGAAYRRRDANIETLLAPLRAEPAAFARAVAELKELAGARVLWCGTGVRRYAPAISAALGAELTVAEPSRDAPSGAQVAAEGVSEFRAQGASNLRALEPVYLRGSDAKLPDEPLGL